MASKFHGKLRERVTPEGQAFIALSVMVVKRINELMEIQKISQTDLAKIMGKSPSEISRWLSGMHNFTLRSLGKLEVVLGAPIVGKALDFDEKEFQEALSALEENLNKLKKQKGKAAA